MSSAVLGLDFFPVLRRYETLPAISYKNQTEHLGRPHIHANAPGLFGSLFKSHLKIP